MSIKLRLFLTGLFTLLVLPNLGARTLWQDEAETALVGKVVATTGLPYAFDQDGPISQDWGYQFSVSPLWRWHPWLQFYLAAISFKLFGVSALTARLPFALTGIIFFWLWLNFIQKYGPKNKQFYFWSIFLVLTSVPLLLHIRQARYYSLALLFTLITVDGYLELKRGNLSHLSYLKYILGSIFLFHSFLPGALALQISFWIHHAWHFLRPDLAKRGRAFIHFAIAFSISLLFTLPWAIWLQISHKNLNLNLDLIKQHLWQHYVYIHKFIFPLILLIPLAVPSIRKRFLSRPSMVLFCLIIALNLALYTATHPYFFRYLIPLIPLFAYLSAWIVTNSPKLIKIILIISLVYSQGKLWKNYLFEVTHPYLGTNEQLVAYFRSKYQNNRKLLAINYDDFTFRFHTNLILFGPQQLTSLSQCPDVVVVYPSWGNEQLLVDISHRCQLAQADQDFFYQKLADDPTPLNHLFSPPTENKLIIYEKD